MAHSHGITTLESPPILQERHFVHFEQLSTQKLLAIDEDWHFYVLDAASLAMLAKHENFGLHKELNDDNLYSVVVMNESLVAVAVSSVLKICDLQAGKVVCSRALQDSEQFDYAGKLSANEFISQCKDSTGLIVWDVHDLHPCKVGGYRGVEKMITHEDCILRNEPKRIVIQKLNAQKKLLAVEIISTDAAILDFICFDSKLIISTNKAIEYWNIANAPVLVEKKPMPDIAGWEVTLRQAICSGYFTQLSNRDGDDNVAVWKVEDDKLTLQVHIDYKPKDSTFDPLLLFNGNLLIDAEDMLQQVDTISINSWFKEVNVLPDWVRIGLFAKRGVEDKAEDKLENSTSHISTLYIV